MCLQRQSVSVWCWYQDFGDLWQIRHPLAPASPSLTLQLFINYPFLSPSSKCNLPWTCCNLVDLRWPEVENSTPGMVNSTLLRQKTIADKNNSTLLRQKTIAKKITRSWRWREILRNVSLRTFKTRPTSSTNTDLRLCCFFSNSEFTGYNFDKLLITRGLRKSQSKSDLEAIQITEIWTWRLKVEL